MEPTPSRDKHSADIQSFLAGQYIDPLPLEASSYRQDLLISTDLFIKAHPNPSSATVLDYSGESGHESSALRQALQSTILFPLSENIAVVDKLLPHSLHELMLIQVGERPISGIDQLEKNDLIQIVRAAAIFFSVCKEENLCPFASITYDPSTVDKVSPQSIKRLHMHLVGYPTGDLHNAALTSAKVKDLDLLTARNILDEATFIINPLLGNVQKISGLTIFELQEQQGGRIRFLIKGGWESLATLEGIRELLLIHQTLSDITAHISTQLRGTSNNLNIDPNFAAKLFPHLIDAEHLESLQNLNRYIARCKLYESNVLTHLPSTNWLGYIKDHITAAAGPIYSLTISGFPDSLYLNINVPMYSIIGGAGVAHTATCAIKVVKGSAGIFTPREMIARRYFQELCLEKFRKEAGNLTSC